MYGYRYRRERKVIINTDVWISGVSTYRRVTSHAASHPRGHCDTSLPFPAGAVSSPPGQRGDADGSCQGLQKCRSRQVSHVLQSTEQHHWNLHSHLVVMSRLCVSYPRPQQSSLHPSGPREVMLHWRPPVPVKPVPYPNTHTHTHTHRS